MIVIVSTEIDFGLRTLGGKSYEREETPSFCSRFMLLYRDRRNKSPRMHMAGFTLNTVRQVSLPCEFPMNL